MPLLPTPLPHRRGAPPLRFRRLVSLAFVLPSLLTALEAHAQGRVQGQVEAQVQAQSQDLRHDPNSFPAALPDAPQAQDATATPNSPGTIHGAVTGRDGAVYESIRVTLTSTPDRPPQTALTDSQGQFRFLTVPAGPYQLTISGSGFQDRSVSGTLKPGEDLTLPPIILLVASTTSQVEVTASTYDIAQEQLAQEEQQRVFALIPNFYVVYDAHPAPLTAKQKYSLATKLTFDYSSFVITGIIAGVEQSDNTFSGYGQGAAGYGKRYAAAYGDFMIGNYLGSAVFPAVFKQDPRYYYKGTGSTRSRILYAIANAVVCKGDNGHWQFNYSGLAGDLAASGISNLYYPAKDRNGASLTFENAAIGIGSGAIANLFQEFLVRKLTPKAHRGSPDIP
jgi:hypothetical protein